MSMAMGSTWEDDFDTSAAQEYRHWEDYRRLKAENAKLRDLCADLYAEMLTYSKAPTYNSSVWSAKLRELGVEVDDA